MELEAAKMQTTGHSFKGFAWSDSLKLEDPGGTFCGSPDERTWKKNPFVFCLLALALAGKFIHPVATAFLHWY